MLPQIRILQQMTQFVMMQPEKIREKMEEQKDVDQASWVGEVNILIST